MKKPRQTSGKAACETLGWYRQKPRAWRHGGTVEMALFIDVHPCSSNLPYSRHRDWDCLWSCFLGSAYTFSEGIWSTRASSSPINSLLRSLEQQNDIEMDNFNIEMGRTKEHDESYSWCFPTRFSISTWVLQLPEDRIVGCFKCI